MPYWPPTYWPGGSGSSSSSSSATSTLASPARANNFRQSLQNDPFIWDDVETVTLTSYRKTGSMIDMPTAAKRRQLTKKERSTSYGAYGSAALVWLIPDLQVTETMKPLKPRDTITTLGGTIFTAQEVDHAAVRSFWRLICLNLSIVEDLQDIIDIQQPLQAYDASGTRFKRWPEDGQGKVLYPQLQARVQLITEDLVEERGIRGMKRTHAVIVSKQLAFDSSWYENRIKWVSLGVTKYLEIVGYHNPERIDELPVIDAVLVP